MIDDYIEFLYVEPISPERIVSTKNSETAYALRIVHHEDFKNSAEEQAILDAYIPTSDALGIEISMEIDLFPYELRTLNADKSPNATYRYGQHAPGEKLHPEKCQYAPGEKVLCLMHEGYDAVFPAIVVGPLTSKYLETLHKNSIDPLDSSLSFEEFIDPWTDWDWDSVIVRPLVRLKNDSEEMGDTAIVNRAYIFPYKQFNIPTKE